jgi:NAD(P)H-nitrite reductase large subunit
VIIGNGSAGNGAAATLRERDPDCLITIITMSSLPFYNRYDLPRIFEGCRDWREILAHPPSYYDENVIALRRHSRVTEVDSRSRTISFAHNERMHYDHLLVCAGGRGYLPERLSDYRHLMHSFGSYEAAMEVYRALPPGGKVVILGGDMIGLDLARTLVATGYRVMVLADKFTFWPHKIAADEREGYLQALERMGMEVVEESNVASIENGNEEKPARRVMLEDGREFAADVVLPFFGLMPMVEFMLSSGVDIERGLLVDPFLRTTDKHIWAAGDVCQIWSDEEKAYRFYYGWNNVAAMGEVAAHNITGTEQAFMGASDERLRIDEKRHIRSPYWEH